jgi:hypothetical protein
MGTGCFSVFGRQRQTLIQPAELRPRIKSRLYGPRSVRSRLFPNDGLCGIILILDLPLLPACRRSTRNYFGFAESRFGYPPFCRRFLRESPSPVRTGERRPSEFATCAGCR